MPEDARSLAGSWFAPVTPDMLAIPGLNAAHLKVWCWVYLETLGRPDWDLSYGQIAKRAGVSRATAIRAVAWLVDHGLVERTRRVDAAGDDAPNLLRAVVPGGGVNSATTPSSKGDTTGGVKNATHQKNHNPKRHLQKSGDQNRSGASRPGSSPVSDDRVAFVSDLFPCLTSSDEIIGVWASTSTYLITAGHKAESGDVEQILTEVHDHLHSQRVFPDTSVRNPKAVILDAARDAVYGDLPAVSFDYAGEPTRERARPTTAHANDWPIANQRSAAQWTTARTTAATKETA